MLFYKIHKIVNNNIVESKVTEKLGILSTFCLQINSVSYVTLMVQEILEKVRSLASYFKWKKIV